MTDITSAIRTPRTRGVLAAVAIAGIALSLTACSSGSESVSDTSWGTPGTEGKPVITFNADGRAGGNDGCNVIGGDWEQKGDKITIDKLVSTMMFCEGVDTWLSQSATAVVKGYKITFSDKDGKEIGSLEKTEFQNTN